MRSLHSWVFTIAQRPKPGNDELSTSELEKMLEEYTEMAVEQIVESWKRDGSPAIIIDEGTKIANLESYLERGIMNIDHLAIIGEWFVQRRMQ